MCDRKPRAVGGDDGKERKRDGGAGAETEGCRVKVTLRCKNWAGLLVQAVPHSFFPVMDIELHPALCCWLEGSSAQTVPS